MPPATTLEGMTNHKKHLERQVPEDEAVEGDAKRPHVGWLGVVGAARPHFGGCRGQAGARVAGRKAVRNYAQACRYVELRRMEEKAQGESRRRNET